MRPWWHRPGNIQLIDSRPGLQAGANGGAVSTVGDTFRVILQTGCTIAVGQPVQVDFSFIATVDWSTAFTVTTTNNGTASSGATLTVNSTPPSLSASTLNAGYNAQYTISDIGASGANGGSWASFTGAANDIELTATADVGFALYNGAAGYSVTYTPSGGSATADAITLFTVGNVTPGAVQSVFLTLTTAIPAGATATVTAEGTNGSTTPSSTTTFSVIPGRPRRWPAKLEMPRRRTWSLSGLQ